MTTSSWPLGFSATGLAAGLSKKKGKKDMALFYSHLPANGGAVFTNNQVKAAPVILTEERLLKTRGHVRAVIVNSGTANAATGAPGLRDAVASTKWAADGLDVPSDQVWVASTGVIGTRIPLPIYRKGLLKMIARVKDSHVSEPDLAAEAIMTTDTVPKKASVTFQIGGVPVRIWGCAKGSGMIHPDMRGPRGQLHATMLVFILTDAAARPVAIQRALEWVADKTFNCVSVDGDTSTNDFVGVLANGASGAEEIASTGVRSYLTFRSALHEVCESLTNQIAMDGEGASKMVQVFIEGARTETSARQMAAVVASSPLVKTACHGADPNWGRILAAMGRSGVKFDPHRVRIWLGDMLVCKGGVEQPFSEPEAIAYLKKKRIVIRVNLGLGHQWSHYKTCDFTGQYVGINAGYRT
ncbi:MAG: bifunctional glutamate N-acetyltransferase/amino-acid acetyltransferase ArgJ [Elusimicrobia bacterium]|nr:bifunctional glutamate N-acetyltransferase/amino-acid acetyltransferase ArgJ [Elusimicrobiota bacterium]